MKKQIRKYSAIGFFISSLIVIALLLVAINQYRLNPPTTWLLELEPTILGAIIILFYVVILIMPAICLTGIIKPEAFIEYPVKLKQKNKDVNLLQQKSDNEITKLFSFKNKDYSKLFVEAN